MVCSGFWKTVGVPLGSINTPVFGFAPVTNEDPSSSKSVDQPLPASTEKGNPLVQRYKPLKPHPPRIPFTQPLALLPQWRPRP